MKIHDRLLRALALTASLCVLCAWAGAVGSSSAADTAHSDVVALARDASPHDPGTLPVESRADLSSIREAYSDGGYWYWLEHRF